MIRCNLAWWMYYRGELTIKELARKAETSPRSIRSLRKNEAKGITFDLMSRLCRVLDCGVADLWVEDPHFTGPGQAQEQPA